MGCYTVYVCDECNKESDIRLCTWEGWFTGSYANVETLDKESWELCIDCYRKAREKLFSKPKEKRDENSNN